MARIRGITLFGWLTLLLGAIYANDNGHYQPAAVPVYGESADGGYVGCLFMDDLCDGREWCYDDYIFGKCLPRTGYSPAQLMRVALDKHSIEFLLRIVGDLNAAARNWDDAFVQCTLQRAIGSVHASRLGRAEAFADEQQCAELLQSDNEDAVNPDVDALDALGDGRRNDIALGTNDEAFIRYVEPVPPAGARGAYATELFSPPELLDLELRAMPPAPKRNKEHAPQQQPKQTNVKPQKEQANEIPSSISVQSPAAQRFASGGEHLPSHQPQPSPRDIVQDIRNRIELRRMLAEYEAGDLPEPVYESYADVLRQLRDNAEPGPAGPVDLASYAEMGRQTRLAAALADGPIGAESFVEVQPDAVYAERQLRPFSERQPKHVEQPPSGTFAEAKRQMRLNIAEHERRQLEAERAAKRTHDEVTRAEHLRQTADHLREAFLERRQNIIERELMEREQRQQQKLQRQYDERNAHVDIDNPFGEQRSTAFREVAREQHIPKVHVDRALYRSGVPEWTNELPEEDETLAYGGEELLTADRVHRRNGFGGGAFDTRYLQMGRRFLSDDDDEDDSRPQTGRETRGGFDVRYMNNRFLSDVPDDANVPEDLVRDRIVELKTPYQLKLAAAAEAEAEEHEHSAPVAGAVYTEGGLIFIPDPKNMLAKNSPEYAKQLKAANMLNSFLGFTRRERLDVKKPGPLVKPDDDAIEVPTTAAGVVASATTDASVGQPKQQQSKAEGSVAENDNADDADSADSADGMKSITDLFSPKKKKILHTLNDHGPHSVDTEYTYVIMRAPIENWSDGPRLVAAIAETLNMKNYLTFSRVDRHEITFRVEENPQRRSAADIARAINESRTKNNLFRRYGYSVVMAGIGDKTKLPLSVSVIRSEQNAPDFWFVVYWVVTGAVGAGMLVICIAVVASRRNAHSRTKLGGLQSGLASVESNSKDYQDLCRTRMSAKSGSGGGVGTPESRIFGGSALMKDDKQQSSSRSSVSSWCDDQATNMDISTGHMVLSYMEDHLKNKGRLQREWEALCRYEAEPSSRDAASKPECAALNRPSAPLPYDHSRVLINHLANTESLDYINASSITDHDPRSAAYIAAQAPLPATLAHFWQMVWEQGSIIIVMLCRLQEMGSIACARYWPEEGSEVYAIYEVHLVSEHTTCDDYLVRSFYLKNLKTGETRTVTQFHFLAWPAFGLPTVARTLLDFRRKVNKSFRGRASPVVVHSSNGAGRAGSYILLDMVLGRMQKGAREIDIAATLEHLRDQRAGLVETQQQFEFVLMAVAEEVHAILKALPANGQNEKQRDLDADAVREADDDDNDADNGDTKRLIDVSDADEDKDVKPEKNKKKK